MSLMEPFIEIGIYPHIFTEYDFQVKSVNRIKSVFKIETQFGEYAVKKSKISKVQAERMKNVLEYLENNNYPVVNLLKNKYGDAFIDLEGSIVYVVKWIDGKPLTLNYYPHLLKSISMMAQLHKLGFSYHQKVSKTPFVDEIYLRNYWEDRISWLKKYEKKLKKKVSKTTFEHIYLTYIPFLLDWAKEAVEYLNNWVIQYNSIGGLRKTICHGRFHHRNIIITTDDRIKLIDFDHFSMDTPVRDIAFFIRHYILDKENRNWTQDWLDAYQQLVPLDVAEKKLLAIYLLFPERMIVLAKRYVDKVNNLSDLEYLNRLQVSWTQMKEMVWFIDSQRWLNE
ncbi:hypothetical protein BHF71_03335 [Vulcanibacillus modesticaldus]|uniref:Aminoglycoside phosphotransferase domain-containing protein n=1 Tax=Vulcanibacillus modesticaldus TaxID=337097 RepID=A0A1D2YSR7_9BACI|nr:phosphotransferase [Vulcanibacillus modesticaldus]OEF98066.1 hypothetical protein BHF71_03335 [Vulcanibacillus modesticaldus]